MIAIFSASSFAALLDLCGSVIAVGLGCWVKNLCQFVKVLCGLALVIDTVLTNVYCANPTDPHLQKYFRVGKAFGCGATLIVATAVIFPSKSDILLFNYIWNWVMTRLRHIPNWMQRNVETDYESVPPHSQ